MLDGTTQPAASITSWNWPTHAEPTQRSIQITTPPGPSRASYNRTMGEVLAAGQNAPVLDALHAVVGKATAQNIAHRYQSAGEMLQALRSALANHPHS